MLCSPWASIFPSAFSRQANNMVIHTACRHFHESQARPGHSQGTPHIVTSSVEHDSVRLPLEQLVKESLAGEQQGKGQGCLATDRGLRGQLLSTVHW